MRPSLRTALAGSHISAVAVAVLLVWSLDQGFRALAHPLARIINFLSDRVTIFNIPSASSMLGIADFVALNITFTYLFNAMICLAAAWLLSRWAYGTGPLRALSKYGARASRRDNV